MNFKILLLFFFIPSLIFAKGFKYDTLANDLRCQTHQIKKFDNQIQKKITFDPKTGRPINQKYISSPSGRFWVHFDTVGTNAVPLVDKNNNGIPDYVDSVAYYADYVYTKEVVEFGFREPLNDSLAGGSEAYDIYLHDIGDGDKKPDSTGDRDWGGNYGMTMGESEVFIGSQVIRMSSLMVIDNNYSPQDSIRYPDGKVVQAYKVYGIDGVKITLAHEFHHAIQYSYNVNDLTSSELSEMSSVCMETLLFPEIKDYLQYVRSLFRNPSEYIFGVSTPENGYRYSIFLMMLNEKYGIEIVKSIWELIGNGVKSFKAIDSALALRNSSLDLEWLHFLKWVFHTNYRTFSLDNQSYFRDAQLMPLFSKQTSQIFSNPSISISGNLMPYQIRLDEMIFQNEFPYSNDTLNIMSTYLDTLSIIYQLTTKEDFTQLVCLEYQNGYKRIFQNSVIPYYYNLISSQNKVATVLFENPGILTYSIANAEPNPLRLTQDDEIIFPTIETTGINQDLTLILYNSNLGEVFRKNLKVSIKKDKRVLILNTNELKNTNRISSGVYIFRVENQNNSIFGKIAIINN